MAESIMSYGVVRGTLVHRVADVQFLKLKQALCAASAVHALQAQRTAVLATMRASARDLKAFAAAAAVEAELAAQIRRARRHLEGARS